MLLRFYIDNKLLHYFYIGTLIRVHKKYSGKYKTDNFQRVTISIVLMQFF